MELKYEFYIDAGLEQVWNTLISPEGTRKTLFGSLYGNRKNIRVWLVIHEKALTVIGQGFSQSIIRGMGPHPCDVSSFACGR
jgi:hypothetical protein